MTHLTMDPQIVSFKPKPSFRERFRDPPFRVEQQLNKSNGILDSAEPDRRPSGRREESKYSAEPAGRRTCQLMSLWGPACFRQHPLACSSFFACCLSCPELSHRNVLGLVTFPGFRKSFILSPSVQPLAWPNAGRHPFPHQYYCCSVGFGCKILFLATKLNLMCDRLCLKRWFKAQLKRALQEITQDAREAIDTTTIRALSLPKAWLNFEAADAIVPTKFPARLRL